MLLVGGYAASTYLRTCVYNALVVPGLVGGLVVPPHPEAAVLSGGWVVLK